MVSEASVKEKPSPTRRSSSASASSTRELSNDSRTRHLNEGQFAYGQSVASARSGWNRHRPDYAHCHTAMMARSEQTDAAAHEILNVLVHAKNRCKEESPHSSDGRVNSPNNRAFRRVKVRELKRSFHDNGKEMRTHSLQLYGCARKEPLQRYLCRCEEDTRTYLPMQAPGVQ